MEDDGSFPIRRPSDEEGFAIVVEKDRSRFLKGREGDHLLTTFQCDLCHFRNLKGHSPLDAYEDNQLLLYIRRANLDAFWARETGTVKNTKRDVASIIRNAASFGLKNILPKMGPFPVHDSHGMGLAVCMLRRSLDTGKNERTIQFATTQKNEIIICQCMESINKWKYWSGGCKRYGKDDVFVMPHSRRMVREIYTWNA